jgi:hypothetical protein
MCGIGRPLTTNAAQFVVHPVIHVEDKLPNGVRKSRNLPCRQFVRKIFDASKRIDVSASAAKQFS